MIPRRQIAYKCAEFSEHSRKPSLYPILSRSGSARVLRSCSVRPYERIPVLSDEHKTAKRSSTSTRASQGFSAEEKAAMRERSRELKAEATKADGEREVLAKIAEMPEPDRTMAEKLHALIKAAAPTLAAKTWYGMPAYTKDGNIICFFQNAGKFKARYQTLGFTDKANLDDCAMWPSSYAIIELTQSEEEKITDLIRQAVS